MQAGGPEWDAEVGDMIEIAIPSDEEAQLVAAGRLAIAPRTYRVIGPTEVHGAASGETFEAALPAGEEAALIAGGHIEFEAEADTATKAELAERARELGIEGRSSMDKDQLAAAIAEATAETTTEPEGGNS